MFILFSRYVYEPSNRFRSISLLNVINKTDDKLGSFHTVPPAPGFHDDIAPFNFDEVIMLDYDNSTRSERSASLLNGMADRFFVTEYNLLFICKRPG